MFAFDPLEIRPYADPAPVKARTMLDGLAELVELHRENCIEYRRMVDTIFPVWETAQALAELPWLPVRLFKRMDLVSVPQEKVLRRLESSGTTGQAVSRIFLDVETASRQAKALSRIVGEFIGRRRMPMVVVDDRSFLSDRTRFNARAAGIVGFSTFGRDHFYCLDINLEPDWDGLEAYLAAHADTPILVFGFTFIVWQQLLERARLVGRSFGFPPGSVLIHGGGWKRLADQRIGNPAFKRAIVQILHIEQVFNYYGMVEQVGSIFFECEAGVLHAPGFADVLVRDPISLAPLPAGREGLIQVLSLLPRSYPGHSLLTEDLGTVLGEDDCRCGRKGKVFSVSGRLPNVEIRGCSDTRAVPTR